MLSKYFIDTNLDHSLEDYTSMKHSLKGDTKNNNFEDGTHDDHNFASLEEAAVLKTMVATMGDWLMGASKAGICVFMVTPT